MQIVDGLLIIDKPAGLTSHDVVARVRRILGEKRVGHTGTLDPFATGVLVVLVGRATRLAQFLSSADKEYEAMIRLGYATDTGDLTGKRLDEPTTPFTAETQRTQSLRREDIDSALASLRGEIDQVPPMYSAKKQQGRKLYELARRGEAIERNPVRITIHEFEVIDHNGPMLTQNTDGTSDLAVRVVCSAGTYVRTLAEDFGKQLGTGAHLAALRRTRAGEFRIEAAITLEDLQKRAEAGALAFVLLPPDAAVSRMPFLDLDVAAARRARNGMDVSVSVEVGARWAEGERVGMRDENGSLIAVGFFDATKQLLHPRVVVAGVE
jgi:tRNA pseudouridine55 synthase